MGTSARGFLLFSFAFSSVLSSPEIAVPANEIQSTELSGTGNNNTVNVAINRCAEEGSCIEKREVIYQPRDEVGARVEKRARIGFTGMRGKKDNYDSQDSDGLDEFIQMLEKRTRMGFNGMRGKRYGEKRAPTAFHGMRGKKSDEYDDDDNDDRMIEYGDDDATEYMPDEEGWEKRTMAFHGMRGRRGSAAEDEPLLTKRMTFDGSYEPKRAMGFLGMRGKKAPETWSWVDYYRGLPSGFYALKGKKAQSGFFGMRGKKNVPGFQGVDALDNEVNTISGVNHSLSSQERVRRATNWLRNSKKARTAFFAVRGKKSTSKGSELNLISGK